MSGLWFLVGSNLENVENSGKTAILSVGYGRIGEIQHGWIRPDWGL